MKAIRKNLTLSIEYGSKDDVIKALQKMIYLIRQGQTRYERELISNAIMEFAIVNVDPIEYKEEIINGQFCHVFPSKMNNELKAIKRKK